MPFGQAPFAPAGRATELAKETGERVTNAGMDCIIACFDKEKVAINAEATHASLFHLAVFLIDNYPEAVSEAARRFAEQEEENGQG